MLPSPALANRPKLLLADEPTASVDIANQENILRLICEGCKRENVSLLLVTHSREVAAKFERIENLSEFNLASRTQTAKESRLIHVCVIPFHRRNQR